MKKVVSALVIVLIFCGLSFAEQVNINTADQVQLEQLPGIGPKKAQQIIDYREKNGSYTSADDLMNISGIGEKTVDRLREDIEVTIPVVENQD